MSNFLDALYVKGAVSAKVAMQPCVPKNLLLKSLLFFAFRRKGQQPQHLRSITGSWPRGNQFTAGKCNSKSYASIGVSVAAPRYYAFGFLAGPSWLRQGPTSE